MKLPTPHALTAAAAPLLANPPLRRSIRRKHRGGVPLLILCAAAFAGCLFAAPAAAQTTRPATRPFLVFEAINGPPPNWDADRTADGAHGCLSADERWANEAGMPSLAAWAHDRHEIVMLDYEHDPVDVQFAPEADVRKTVDLYLSRVAALRRADPSIRVGFYGLCPIRNFWTPVNLDRAQTQPKPWVRTSELAKYQPWQAAWEHANSLLQPLADAADFSAPSCYLFSANEATNKAYIRGNLAEARKLGKPVYAVFFDKYVGSYDGAKQGQPIPQSMIAPLIKMVVDEHLADAVILWGATFDDSAKLHLRLWVDGARTSAKQ